MGQQHGKDSPIGILAVPAITRGKNPVPFGTGAPPEIVVILVY
jgi:hypothetical protein